MKLGLLLGVLMLAHPVGAADRLFSVSVGGYVTLCGVDVAQTAFGIGTAQVREANPIVRPVVPHPALFGAVKTGSAVGLAYGLIRLRASHPTLATALALIGVALEGVVVTHNQRVLGRITR